MCSTLIVTILTFLWLKCASTHEYCQHSYPGTEKLFCLGVKDQQVFFGSGSGCLMQSDCEIIISGLTLYPNSTWFKIYILIPSADVLRTDVYFMITKKEISFSKNSTIQKRLGVRDVVIAKGELMNNQSFNIYSYMMSEKGKLITSPSFFAFAPDKISSRQFGSLGSQNYTIFSWRSSDHLIENWIKYNYHETPVQVTLRIVSRTQEEDRVTIVQTERYLLFQASSKATPTGEITMSRSRAEEL